MDKPVSPASAGLDRRPNVVFIFTDQHRADMLSCTGETPVRTPHLDRLAAGGTRLTRARCTTPLCMPSRTTYFTGCSARRNGTLANEIRLNAGGAHLATRLREAGYALALAGKNHAFTDDELRQWDFVELYHMHGKEEKDYCSPPTEAERAVAKWRQECVPFFEAAVHEPQPGRAEDDPAIAQTDHALRFLEDQAVEGAEHPFFLWLSYEAPHFPYVLPEPWFSRHDPARMPGLMDEELWKNVGPVRLRLQHAGLRMDEMTDTDIRRVQASYCGMIELVDEQVGRVLDALERLKMRENTLIVFVADHGDFWGHRGLIGKSNALYEDLLRIPTIWSLPGQVEGRTSSAIIENTDFTPTLLDLLGLDPMASAQGSSYATVLQGASDRHRDFSIGESSLGLPALTVDELEAAVLRRDELFSQEGPMWFVNRIGGLTRSLYRPPYKLITHEQDASELYDLENDPGERENLAAQPAMRPVLGELLRQLETTSLA
ncbi:MAG: sulfatase-like hydrolase/transferase [Verrucomicrobiota bacterium JB024]|nr:sulfatase-like hydrolase/transferase [Verrucomicrobiota bacterium JB024]